jgi:hypothetical protein
MDRLLPHLGQGHDGHLLLLAGGQALPRLHPLDGGGLGVADRPPDADVGRAVAAHARLGEPRKANLETCGHFFSGQQR